MSQKNLTKTKALSGCAVLCLNINFINLLITPSEEEEKSEYTRLCGELADIMDTAERETTEFDHELSQLQTRKKRTDREIRNIETDYENSKNKILKTARNSQTAEPISLETIHTINKKLAVKEAELRLLRINQETSKLQFAKLQHSVACLVLFMLEYFNNLFFTISYSFG